MIFLDIIENLADLDPSNLLEYVDQQPEHYEAAWALGQTLAMPRQLDQVRQVIMAGMGSSAIAGELLASFVASTAPMPIQVVRGYTLPAYAQGEQTLVIILSFSGNTEEVLAVYEQAQDLGTQILVVSTGGKLVDQAKHTGHTVWQFAPNVDDSRHAIGWFLGLLLALADRAAWVPPLKYDFADSLDNLKKYRDRYRVYVPANDNPAKRQAGQYVGRIPMAIGSGVFEVVARRWKTQLNQISKFWAMNDALPEMDHNTIVGIQFPADLMTHIGLVFITSREYDHPRVAVRHSLTFKLFLQNGFNVDKFRPRGRSLLAQMMHAIFYGDYVSFYAAIACETNPTLMEPILELKKALSATAD